MRDRHDMTILMISDFLTNSTDFALQLLEKRKQQEEDESKGRGLNIPWSVLIASSSAISGLLAFLSSDQEQGSEDSSVPSETTSENADPAPDTNDDDGSSLLDRVVSWISGIPEVSKPPQSSSIGSTNYGQTLVGPEPQTQPQSRSSASDYIMMAAQATGQDPSLIYSVAKIESGLNVGAKNKITNATGLLQITPSTWKFLIKKYRHLGFTEQDINDPQKNALVGALYLRDISSSLSSALKRSPSPTEVYIGHFLGPTGAIRFLRALRKKPETLASDISPAAAKANIPIFYDRGRARTVQEIWDLLNAKVVAAKASYVTGVVSVEASVPVSKYESGAHVSSGHSIPVQQQTAPTSSELGMQQTLNSKVRARQASSAKEEYEYETTSSEVSSSVSSGAGVQQRPTTYVRSKNGVVYTIPL
jgi:hypothetical protein